MLEVFTDQLSKLDGCFCTVFSTLAASNQRFDSAQLAYTTKDRHEPVDSMLFVTCAVSTGDGSVLVVMGQVSKK